MDKKKFRVLIKHGFLAKRILCKPSLGLINIIWTLHQENQPLRSGLLSLNEVKWVQRTMHVVDAPKEATKTSKKSAKYFWMTHKVKLVETLKIWKERVRHILNECLGMRKLCAKWVPRELTIDQKQQRIDDSELCLKLFNRNKTEFMHRYETKDRAWLHHFTLEPNRQSAEYAALNEPTPKREMTQRSVSKNMASVFWYAHGIIFIDYLKREKHSTATIT